MPRLLFALLLLLPAFQDAESYKDLVRKLDAAGVDEREKAMEDLVAAGEAALPALKEGLAAESPEVRSRCDEAIRRIAHEAKVRGIYKEPKPLALKFEDAPLMEILAELTAQSGKAIETSAVPKEARGSLVAASCTLMEALDRLCAAQPKLSWDFNEKGAVKMLAEKHADRPAAYSGAFRVAINSVDVTRTTNFKESTIAASLLFGATWDPSLSPMKRTRFAFTKVVDDQGREVQLESLAAQMFGGAAMPAGMVIRIAGMGGDEAREPRYGLKGLQPDAKTLKSVQGTATFSFPLDAVPVTFSEIVPGDKQVVGDFTIRIDKVQPSRNVVDFLVIRTKGEGADIAEEVERRLDASTVIAVDKDGAEHKAESLAPPNERMGMVIMGGPGGGGEVEKTWKLRATFPTLGKKDIQSMRLKFVDKTWEKAIPFEIKDVRLP